MDFAKEFCATNWIGFKNFEYLFKTPDAFTLTRNTLLYNVAFIIVNLVNQRSVRHSFKWLCVPGRSVEDFTRR